MGKGEKVYITSDHKVKSLNGRWFEGKNSIIEEKRNIIEQGSINAIEPDLNNNFVATSLYKFNGNKWHMSVVNDNLV